MPGTSGSEPLTGVVAVEYCLPKEAWQAAESEELRLQKQKVTRPIEMDSTDRFGTFFNIS